MLKILKKYYTRAREVTANNQSEILTDKGEQEEEALEKVRRRGAGGRERGTRSPECCTGYKPASFPLNNRNHKRSTIYRNELQITAHKKINYQ